MVSRVATETGLDLQYESLKEEVSGNLGRPHMAETLVEKGVVSSIGAAFAEYLGENRTAYVPMERLPHETVIEAIHSAGGAVSLAHPGRIRSDHVPEMVDRLVDAGLNGIEAWYPYDESNSDAYSDVGVAEAMTLARTHDLIPTGGSDCHGQESGKFRIGTVRTPESTIDAIRRKSTSYHE